MSIKRIIFISLFILVQLAFLFLYLNKQDRLIALSYDRQKNEQKLELLKKEKEKWRLLLEERKTPANIKKYAQTQLKMQPMKLSDIRKIADG